MHFNGMSVELSAILPSWLIAIGIPLIIIISMWEVVWTALACWRAARRGNPLLFIIFLAVNFFGIPEIVYLTMTRNKKVKSAKPSKSKKKKR